MLNYYYSSLPDHLYQIVLNRIFSLEKLLIEIKRTMPRFGPLLFLEAIEHIVLAIKDSFLKETKDLPIKTREELLRSICLSHLGHLQKIHNEYVPLVLNIESSFIRSEFKLPLLESIEMFEKRKNFAVFLQPFWDYNYEFWCFVDLVNYNLSNYRNLDKNVIEQAKRFPRWFIFILYPYVEHKNALLHTLIMHEVAHFVDIKLGFQRYLSRKILLDESQARKTTKDFLKQPLPKIPKVSSKKTDSNKQLTMQDIFLEDTIHKSITNTFAIIRNNWVKEFVSDLLALRFIGPGYFFALYELAITSGNFDSYSSSHPSFRRRLITLLEELDNLGYLEKSVNDNLKNILDNLNIGLRTENLEPNEQIELLVYNSIFRNGGIDYILRWVRRYVNESRSYNITKYEDEVDKVTQAFRQGIPPAEIWISSEENKPFSIPAIINAAWLFYLSDVQSFFGLLNAQTFDEKALALENYNELILKAIESQYILSISKQEQWKEEKDDID